MLEVEHQDRIIELARILGWRVAHFRAARTKHGWTTPVAADGKGFVDLVLVHPAGWVIFAEVKTDKGKLSPEQRQWGDLFTAAFSAIGARVVYAVWRPRDWDDIVAALQAPRTVH